MPTDVKRARARHTKREATERTCELTDLVDESTRALIHDRRLGNTHRRGWIMRRALAAADLISLTAAFVLAEVAFGNDRSSVTNRVSPAAEIALFAVTLPVWLVLARAFGLYVRDEERADHRSFDDTTRVFIVVTIGSWGLLVIAWLTGAADPYLPKLFTFWVMAVLWVSIARFFTRTWVRRSSWYLQNTIVVGAGEIGQLVASKVLRHPEFGINLLGFVDEAPNTRRDDLGDLPLLGRIDELSSIVAELDVERVIVAFRSEDPERLMSDLRLLRHDDVQVDIVPRLFDIVGPDAQVHALEGVPLVGLPPTRLSRGSRAVKRGIDLAGSIVGLIILLPLLAYIAIRIKLDSPGPVYFRQRRPGRDGAWFDIVKFRTMYVSGPEQDSAPQLAGELAAEYQVKHKLVDDPRITPFGKWLRRTSLDELPQLWNVLCGDMSLVGPRPMLADELGRPGNVMRELLVVKPGMTGYWQVNGRSDTDYDDRLRLELNYVSNWSTALDLSILVRTLPAIVSGRGAS